MAKAVLRLVLLRGLLAVPILLLVTLFTFVMLFKVGDPAAAIAGEDATQQRIEETRVQLGLDRPIMVQYGDWLGGAVTGDLGESMRGKGPTTTVLASYAPPTVVVVTGAMLVSILFSLLMGIAVALRPHGWLDRLMRGVAMLGVAIPNFLLGLVLTFVFAVRLHWLPPGGFRSWGEEGFNAVQYWVLPISALAVALICQQMRTLRASLLKEYQADYVRSARMKGLSETRIFFRHVLRNAAAPFVTVVGLEIGALVTGSILVEAVFDLDGIGSLALRSVQSQDFQIVQAVVLFGACIVLLANTVADAVALILNPTVRKSRG